MLIKNQGSVMNRKGLKYLKQNKKNQVFYLG